MLLTEKVCQTFDFHHINLYVLGPSLRWYHNAGLDVLLTAYHHVIRRNYCFIFEQVMGLEPTASTLAR